MASIGVSLLLADDGRVLFSALDDGGAAGSSGMIHEGDELIAVEKQAISGMVLDEILALLDGAEGSLVKVKVRRGGQHTYSVCLERSRSRHGPSPRHQAWTPSSTRPQAVDEKVVSVQDRIYLGQQRLNEAIAEGGGSVAGVEARLTKDELEVFIAEKHKEVGRAENEASRRLNAERRQKAEVAVLRRECEALERSGAAFDQIIEYRAWIHRLESAGGSRAKEKALRRAEAESEREEMAERLTLLIQTMQALQGGEHTAAEEEVLLHKISIAEETLKTLGVYEGRGRGHQGTGLEGRGSGESVLEERGGDILDHGGRQRVVDVALDLEARWKANSGRSGAGVAGIGGGSVSGTMEPAPEPCMLASATGQAIESLVRGVY